jgi:hypothetical protein
MAAARRRLAVYVTVAGRPGDSAGFATFGPDDEVPAWAAEQMGEHVWEKSSDAEAKAKADAEAKAKADAEAIPAKAGAGSSKDAWAAYAAAHDVTVDENASRDDIIAACEAAGVPVAKPVE